MNNVFLEQNKNPNLNSCNRFPQLNKNKEKKHKK